MRASSHQQFRSCALVVSALTPECTLVFMTLGCTVIKVLRCLGDSRCSARCERHHGPRTGTSQGEKYLTHESSERHCQLFWVRFLWHADPGKVKREDRVSELCARAVYQVFVCFGLREHKQPPVGPQSQCGC